MVRRFVAAGHEVDVLTSDAHDLWYFTDKGRRRVEAPAESRVDGARVRRFAVRHLPFQRYVGRLLSYAPHWPTRCRRASYMPILPGIEPGPRRLRRRLRRRLPLHRLLLCRLPDGPGGGRAADPDAVPPPGHARRPGQPALHPAAPDPPAGRGRRRRRPDRAGGRRRPGLGHPRSRILTLGMAVEHAEVTGGDRDRFRERLAIPDRPRRRSATSPRSTRTRGRTTWSAPSRG